MDARKPGPQGGHPQFMIRLLRARRKWAQEFSFLEQGLGFSPFQEPESSEKREAL